MVFIIYTNNNTICNKDKIIEKIDYLCAHFKIDCTINSTHFQSFNKKYIFTIDEK